MHKTENSLTTPPVTSIFKVKTGVSLWPNRDAVRTAGFCRGMSCAQHSPFSAKGLFVEQCLAIRFRTGTQTYGQSPSLPSVRHRVCIALPDFSSFGCGSPMENQLAPLAGGRHDGCHIGLRRGIFRPQSLTKPGPNTGTRFLDDIRQVQLPALPNAPAPDD